MEAYLTPIAIAFLAWCLWQLGKESLLTLTLNSPGKQFIFVAPTLLFYAASGAGVVYFWTSNQWTLATMYSILQPHFLVLFLGAIGRGLMIKKEEKKADKEAKFRLPMMVILYVAILLTLSAGVDETGPIWPAIVLIVLYFMGFAGEGKLRKVERDSSLA